MAGRTAGSRIVSPEAPVSAVSGLADPGRGDLLAGLDPVLATLTGAREAYIALPRIAIQMILVSASEDGRFGDKRKHLAATVRFKVLDAPLDPKACFLETVIRDRRQYPIVLPDPDEAAP